jgi:hypothetical protein
MVNRMFAYLDTAATRLLSAVATVDCAERIGCTWSLTRSLRDSEIRKNLVVS